MRAAVIIYIYPVYIVQWRKFIKFAPLKPIQILNKMSEKEIEITEEKKGLNFVEQIVWDDLQAGKNGGRLNTRFPPEPNGYLHIGHAKAICMDFGVAEKFGGTCNLRFDDTNPAKEDVEYVDSIKEDIHWLGFDWGDREYYASDYFPKLYDLAVRLIKE